MEEKEKFNQSKYNYQWAQENYYRLTVLLPKNQKDKIKAHAHAMEQIRRRDARQRTRDQTRAEAQPNAERNRKQQNTGPLAQLNRVFDYGSKGYRFESCMGHKRDNVSYPFFFVLCYVCAT